MKYLNFSTSNQKYVADLLYLAEPLLSQIPVDRRNFYQAQVLTQIQIHLQSLKMLKFYCKCALAYNVGKNTEALLNLDNALQASNDLVAALYKAEYSKWAGWYMGDHLVDLTNVYDLMRAMKSRLTHEPIPPMRTRGTYAEDYKYQEPFLKNFPLLYPKTSN
jgi:hypothetical protein